jgi:hypothetical protein
MPFVSQICFSKDFGRVACLINGPANYVVIYKITKDGQIIRVGTKEFPVAHYEDSYSPGHGDQTRVSAISKQSVRTIIRQSVTQISFNPKHFMKVVMSGPDCRLDYCRLEKLDEFIDEEDEKMA